MVHRTSGERTRSHPVAASGDGDAGPAVRRFLDDPQLLVRAPLATRVQLTTDGHKAYLEAVEGAFGDDVDYAMLVKLYGEPTGQKGHERKYSPAVCTGARKVRIEGDPDRALVSTSHVERQNLTMRMHMRRFTRLTNAFSKKVQNHAYAVALHFMYYNLVRQHQRLRVSPAMAAGVSETLRDVEWIVSLIDARAARPGPRGSYRKREIGN